MQRVISFIVARDENNQEVLMNVEVDENFSILNLNIAGYVLLKEEVETVKIKIKKELFDALKDNEPLDITSRFSNMTNDEILKSLKETK